MTILSSELRAYPAADMSNGSTSGGRITFTALTSGALQNVFPHVFKATRTAGNVANPDHRKIFWRNINDADEAGYNPGQYLFRPNPSDAWCYQVIGTQRSTRADLDGSEAKYGAGLLAAGVSAGATTITVRVKHADLTGCFATGRPCRISTKLLASSTTGTEEEFTPTNVTVDGLVVTLTIGSPGLTNGYTAGGATDYLTGCVVFSVYYPTATELECTVDNWDEGANGAVYDETASPVVGDNIGTAEQTWTLTRTGDTTFSVAGDTITLTTPTGSTAADFAPINPANGKPYFTLAAAGWTTTLPSGYTLVFQTHPPAIPVHQIRVVPPNCGPLAGDQITSVLEVETVAV